MSSDRQRAFWVLIAGIVASAIMGAVLSQAMETWLWVTITLVGMAVSVIWFMMTARS